MTMSLNAMTLLNEAQMLATTATLRLPGLMMHAASLSALGEFVLKGASQLTNIPGIKSVYDSFAEDEGYGHKGAAAIGLTNENFKSIEERVRPFKKDSAVKNLATAVGLWAASTAMLELTNVLCGAPHPIYNQIMNKVSWLKIQDTSVLSRAGII